MQRPVAGDEWVGITTETLPIDQAVAWSTRPECGAVVMFAGTVRDHAEGRTDVIDVTYEAYEEQAVARLEIIAAEARVRFGPLGAVVLLHRTGTLAVGEASVLVVASAAHRDAAFSAARWCIDTVKATVPIWKHERWATGSDWGTGAVPITGVQS